MPDSAGMPLTFGKILENPDARAQGIEGMTSSPWDETQWLGMAQTAQHAIESSMAQTGLSPFGEELNLPPPLSPEEANARYGIPGALEFKEPVQDFVAQNIYNDKREELYRADAASRRPPGLMPALASFGANFVAQTLDPVNLAASFIPVVGEARYASWLARAGEAAGAAGRIGVRAGVGAARGIAGQAALEPLQIFAAHRLQDDYGASDAMLDLAYGGLLGGGLHVGLGPFGDPVSQRFRESPAARIAEADPAARESALRTALAQTAEDQPVEVRPSFLSSTEAPIVTQLVPRERSLYEPLPVLDTESLRVLGERTQLTQRSRELEEFINGLEISPGAAAARDTLARLETVERNLAAPDLTPEAQRQLLRRRDELLTDTNPETLHEAAAPLEFRRSAQAQQAQIAARLADIEREARGKAADRALSPLPKVAPPERTPRAGEVAHATALAADRAARLREAAALIEPTSPARMAAGRQPPLDEQKAGRMADAVNANPKPVDPAALQADIAARQEAAAPETVARETPQIGKPAGEAPQPRAEPLPAEHPPEAAPGGAAPEEPAPRVPEGVSAAEAKELGFSEAAEDRAQAEAAARVWEEGAACLGG